MNSEVLFDLEAVAWPILVVDGEGVILQANQAALILLEPAQAGEIPALTTLWAADNCVSAEKFLKDGATALAPLTPLRLELSGGPKVFSALVGAHSCEGNHCFLLQLLPEFPATLPLKTLPTDPTQAHRQKLDCALQLARSVALDFNNALTSILGYTSLLLSKAEAAHPWRRTLLEMEKSAAKAAEVAADLAAFSLQEKEPRAQAAGNLNTVLQRCLEFFQKSRAEPTAWIVRLERRLFSARFDEAKIQQAFMKILENAVESLRHDGRVTVQTRNLELNEPTQDLNARLAAGTYVCVEIADNGVGIEAAVMPRIFEPFFTTKKGNHRGLGLAWVYGILTNHGGGVAVSSVPGTGTSVRLYLPAEMGFVRESLDAATDLSGTQTILLVDDEDLLLRMGETILSTYGYRVLTANNGHQALEILAAEETPVDLLITDLVMPVMSGRELVEQVRKLSPETHIICTSGYVWPGGKQDPATFLQKPFTTQELLMKVKQSLAKARTAS